jgi:hypothetical protein
MTDSTITLNPAEALDLWWAVGTRIREISDQRRYATEWFRVWACPQHLEGLTGLRQFGMS